MKKYFKNDDVIIKAFYDKEDKIKIMKKSLTINPFLKMVLLEKNKTWENQFVEAIKACSGSICLVKSPLFLEIESKFVENGPSKQELFNTIENTITNFFKAFHCEKIQYNNDSLETVRKLKSKISVTRADHLFLIDYFETNNELNVLMLKVNLKHFLQKYSQFIYLFSSLEKDKFYQKLKLERDSLIRDVESKIIFKVERMKDIKNTISSLKSTSQKLISSKNKIDSIISEVNNHISSIQLSIKVNKKCYRSLKDKLDMARTLKTEIVIAKPGYNQICQLVAEEAAIEDFIIYMRDGLVKKKISLELFLKTVRRLSHRHFIIRATILLARQKLNLKK